MEATNCRRKKNPELRHLEWDISLDASARSIQSQRPGTWKLICPGIKTQRRRSVTPACTWERQMKQKGGKNLGNKMRGKALWAGWWGGDQSSKQHLMEKQQENGSGEGRKEAAAVSLQDRQRQTSRVIKSVWFELRLAATDWNWNPVTLMFIHLEGLYLSRHGVITGIWMSVSPPIIVSCNTSCSTVLTILLHACMGEQSSPWH